jgi:acyl dehydratase
VQFGRYYEEFEVGAVYKHWPGKTVTEYDDHLFCLLTMNHHPLHLDAQYAATTQQGRNVVVGNYVYSLLLGMSVADVSGRAIANLEVESLKHVFPTFHGDTVYGQTEVLGQEGEHQQGRPRGRARRDQGLQPGRRADLHLPAQGDDPQAQLRGGERRGVPRPTGAARVGSGRHGL